MSFLSVLGKIGAGIAAPFTGGASLAAIPAIDAIGGALGSGAASAAAGRRSDSADQAAITAQNNQTGLNAAAFNRDTQSQLQRRALLAKLLQGAQDYQINDPRMPNITGGLRPSTLSPAFQSALANYTGGIDASLANGSYQFQPQQAQFQKPGLLEKIGGIAGIAGGLSSLLPQQGMPQVATMPRSKPMDPRTMPGYSPVGY